MGAVAATATTLLVLVFRWHVTVAVSAALLCSLGVTALVVQQATEADGIQPTRYDKIVIAIGAACGALLPALLLAFMRWLNRFVEAEERLAAEERLGRSQRST
jgi:ABC-type enterobactin transport system permease subunit